MKIAGIDWTGIANVDTMGVLLGSKRLAGERILRTLLTGLLLLLASIAAGHASDEMSFRLTTPQSCGRPCPVVILAQGRITQDSYRSFDAVVRTLPPHTPVVLNSNGGSFVGGILLGLALRQNGSAVLVPRGGVCASACVYAFLGGVVRHAPEGARIGVHRFFAVNRYTGQRSMAYERSVTPQAMALLTNYVQAMGASTGLVGLAARVEPSEIHFLNRRELQQYRIVTGGASVARRPGRHGQVASGRRGRG